VKAKGKGQKANAAPAPNVHLTAERARRIALFLCRLEDYLATHIGEDPHIEEVTALRKLLGGEPGADKHTTPEEHRLRHVELHDRFDELLADFLRWHPGKYPSNTTALELMQWSHAQTIAPTEEGR
jgi:hypothetical protein